MLNADVGRAFRMETGSRARRFVSCLRSPGLHAVITYRFRHWLRNQPLPIRFSLYPISVYMDYRMRSRWGIEIHSGATIGEGFVILHHGGIFVSSHSIIGRNFTIAHDVTVGTAGTGTNAGAPVIGNNVTINPGAKVHGRIHVGNNVRIGPNSVVNRNVPDDALVHPPAMQVVRFPTLYGTGDENGQLEEKK